MDFFPDESAGGRKMKERFVKEIQAGEAIDDLFLLSAKNVLTKRDGKSYLRFVLSDRTGTLPAVMWDGIDGDGDDLEVGELVEVSGRATSYQGQIQITVRGIRRCAQEQIDPSCFLPQTRKDVEKMFERLMTMIDSIQTPWIKSLLYAVFRDETFGGQFRRAPAAKHMHHAYLGGLLEHTLSVTVLADRVASHYIGVDRDLLISGALLHDVGKVFELDFRHAIDYTNEGRLLSHVVLGLRLIDECLQTVQDTDPEKVMLLRHLVVSHHGRREFGSPEEPKTIEAMILNYVDEIDAKVTAVREMMNNTDAKASWTQWHRLLERQFYVGLDNQGL